MLFLLRALLIGAALIGSIPAASLADTGAPAEEESGDRGWLLLPVLAYSPETSVMLGVSGLRFFQLDPEAESSVFSPVAIVTSKKQILLFLGSRLEWERDRVEITPSYQRFPDTFYGLGRDVLDEAEEDYTPESIGVEAAWRHEVLPHLQAGLTYLVKNHRLKEVAEGGLLASGDITGVERTLVSVPGLLLDFDTRDNLWAPRRGLWLTALAGFSRSALGSDAHFDTYTLDLRAYRPLGHRGLLAFQLQGQTLGGGAPFFMMPTLGGQEGLRGYLEGRYRHRTRALGRVEYRSQEVWGRFGWVAFAGLGDVADRPAHLSLKGELWTFGAGLRYTLDETEKVKLRLDVGFGHGDGGFFLAFGEAY